MALVSGIDNVHVYVRDMQRSLHLYRDVLGIPLAGDAHWSDADLGGVRFALHAAPDGVEPATGTVFVNFAVDDVESAAERVRASGYDVREHMREDYGTSYELVDPDGYRVYLFQGPS